MVTRIEQFESPPAEQRDDEPVVHHPGFEAILKLTGLVPTEYLQTASLGPPVPSELLLGSLRDGRLRVCSPITVKLMTEGEHIIAEAAELNEFGFGKNPSEALIDLQRAIAELYFTLEREQRHLGPDLQGVWATLQQKILKRHDHQGTRVRSLGR
ncbi:MAG: hypothetical protein Q8O76_05830 [Chloroflexota bacterium]|nr:hypothetical protein [Chloroflexota bacterium]